MGGSGCYKCGKTGHFCIDCTQVSSLSCFHFNQTGHKKADYPRFSEIEITDDSTVKVPSVHRGCILKLFHKNYLIDLVPITIRGTTIIVGMHWLS